MKYNEHNPPEACMLTNSTCYRGTRTMTIKGVLWHSTGANNPTLKRYVQPSEGASDFNYWMEKLGRNAYKNDFNHIYREAGLNCWIGKAADDSIMTVQTMPWNYRPWGCGSGPKGSCNDGWIQFEICEDSTNDAGYFNLVYQEACEITAYLCKKYGLDPYGYANLNGVQVPVITTHCDSYKLQVGGGHADVMHWLPKFGKNMDTVRQDVAAIMANENKPITPPKEEEDEEEMTQEKFDTMMNEYLKNISMLEPSPWSQNARVWAEANGIISGDAKGNKMYQKTCTRQELVQMFFKFAESRGLL